MPIRFNFVAFWMLFLCTILLTGCGGDAEPETAVDESPEFGAHLEVVGNLDGLSGHLLFIEQRAQPNFRIGSLDLGSGEVSTLFDVPQNGWVYEVTGTAEEELIFTYSPPSETGEAQLDQSAIFRLDLSNPSSTPEPLVPLEGPGIYMSLPELLFAGSSVFFTRIDTRDSSRAFPAITLQRKIFSTESQIEYRPQARMASYSAEIRKMAYMNVNPTTAVNSVLLLDMATNQEQVLIREFEFFDVTLALLEPNGQWLYFVQIPDPVEDQSFIENILYGEPVFAHGNHTLPGDWWRRSLDGTTTERVTDLELIIHSGVISPDGRRLAFSTQEGIYVIDLNGGEPQLLIKSRAIGHIDWID